MEPKTTIYSVYNITRKIKELLEDSCANVWVEGEILTLRRPSSGHFYFTLKDARSQMPCAMFRRYALRCSTPLEDGMKVQCQGDVSVYEPHGRYQLIVHTIKKVGTGDLLEKLEQLKGRLKAEGLFDTQLKQPLPFLPRTIGIVTSPTGAAIRDMIRTITNLYPATILLCPSLVQGSGAAQEIARGIKRLDEMAEVDVIIVGRGGGSLEDLWPFNEEIVARTIAEAKTPIISAVGHEIDVALSDLVADVRAATPTAAGELVVPDLQSLAQRIEELQMRLGTTLRHQIDYQRERVLHLSSRLGDEQRLLNNSSQHLDELGTRLINGIKGTLIQNERCLKDLQMRLPLFHPRNRLKADSLKLTHLEQRAREGIARLLSHHREVLKGNAHRLQALNPKAILERGYSITRDAHSGRVIRDSAAVSTSAELKILLHQGALDVVVTSKENE